MFVFVEVGDGSFKGIIRNLSGESWTDKGGRNGRLDIRKTDTDTGRFGGRFQSCRGVGRVGQGFLEVFLCGRGRLGSSECHNEVVSASDKKNFMRAGMN